MEKTMTKNIVCKFLAFSIALLPTSLFAWEIYEESRVDGTTDTIRYPQSSTRRCWTCRSHTAHAHGPPPYAGVTGIVGSVACGHWRG